MAYELENIVREWMDHLKGLNVHCLSKKFKNSVIGTCAFRAPALSLSISDMLWKVYR